MLMTFFNAADRALFVREDDEEATWQVEEFSLRLLYPYRPDKVIERGMRVGFQDDDGAWQVFELRTVKTYEPDHYQEIDAEHIAVSELTDEHLPKTKIEDMTADQALGRILTGTRWAVGTFAATEGLASYEFGVGSVWQSVNAIRDDWNAYITPRITVENGAITGRYLDITLPGGTWRGLRLAIDKNADEMGVTYDDTDVITAMYGYGATTDDEPLTFDTAVWEATADHPAKPAGQKYLEDPEATALYGRNGRPRYGYYTDSQISSAETLLQKTWESLQTTNAPRVTVDCMVRDLYRLGYADEPIRLHDLALVEVEPIGVTLRLEIIKLAVNLNDPTATRPVIGAYIPNIVYVQKEIADAAGGGGGGGGGGGSAVKSRSGRGGSNGRGQTSAQQQKSEFETAILRNQYEISLRAYQRDVEDMDQIVRQAQVDINSHGVTIEAHDTELTAHEGRITANEASIAVVPDKITAAVSNKVDKSSVEITADSITVDTKTFTVDAQTVVSKLAGQNIVVGNLTASNFTLGGNAYTGHLIGFTSAGATGTFLGTADLSLHHFHSISFSESGGQITATIGGESDSEGSDSFNIAATATYRNGVAAAKTTGATEAVAGLGVASNNYDSSTKLYTLTLTNPTYGLTRTITTSGVVAYNAGHTDGYSEGEADGLSTGADNAFNNMLVSQSYIGTDHNYAITLTYGGRRKVIYTDTMAYDYGEANVTASVGSWSGGQCTVTLSNNQTATVYMPSSYSSASISCRPNVYSGTVYASVTIGGQTYSFSQSF